MADLHQPSLGNAEILRRGRSKLYPRIERVPLISHGDQVPGRECSGKRASHRQCTAANGCQLTIKIGKRPLALPCRIRRLAVTLRHGSVIIGSHA
ncbi:hypothetical protein [Serratia fonticola]|uniref:hypothetical protein n=1 Tax=Serratia fonticola TaxID=47917 RepID=UPI003AACDB57